MEPEEIIKKPKRELSFDHKQKLSDARDKYWEKVRALKKLAPEVAKLSGELAGVEGSLEPLKPTQAREHVIRKIFNKKDKLLDAQIDAATGMHMMVDGKRMYQKAPDRASGEYLLNQLIGKPTESLEIKQITKIQVDI